MTPKFTRSRRAKAEGGVKAVFTKVFDFSASYSSGPKVLASNYRLAVTTRFLDDTGEALLEKKIRESLIQKIHSRDLSLHVDFLKGETLTEPRLVQIFWKKIEEAIAPEPLLALSLERDNQNKFTLSLE